MGLRLKSEKILVKDGTERLIVAESKILQNAQEIALRVTSQTYNALVDRVQSAESDLIIQAGLIASRVTTTTFNALNNRVTNAESTILQQADQIALRVAKSDFNGNSIASLINQTATTIKLQASKITLEGLITANNNFKVLADGSIEAVNAKLSGAITATKMISPNSPNYFGEIGVSDGLVGLGLYDLRYDSGPYMRIVELTNGTGFALMDTNDIQRATFGSGIITLRDSAGNIRAEFSNAITRFFSPGGNMRFSMTNNYVNITNNGVTLANWG